jgi:hypothetical protein
MRDNNFIWDPGTFKVLGIMFSTDTTKINQINYNDKLLAMKRILFYFFEKKKETTIDSLW